MERIKQALDKIRSVGNVRFDVERAQATPEIRPEIRPERPPELDNISYTHSRVVQLDAKHLERHRIVAYSKDDPAAISFDQLRTQVLRRMKEKGWQTLAITSPTPGAGKTVVAINLAISIAKHTETTALLVDFDLRRPKIAAYLGLPRNKSFNELLSNEATLSEILVNPGIPRLLVLPTEKPVSKSSELLTSRRIVDLVTELRGRYDSRLVIFDLPPILTADDAAAILPHIDCSLLVIADGSDSKTEIEDSMALMQRVNFLGTVLNKSDVVDSNKYSYY